MNVKNSVDVGKKNAAGNLERKKTILTVVGDMWHRDGSATASGAVVIAFY